MKKSNLIITIDGPGATGKSTVAWRVAQRLNIGFLNSGSIYRIAAYLAQKNNYAYAQVAQLAKVVNEAKISFKAHSDNDYTIYVNAKDVTNTITSDAIGLIASNLSKDPLLRELLIEKQRQFDQDQGLVADGRDMGSKIFPNASHKFFLTAPPMLRAKRRYKQLQEKGIDANLEEVYQALLKRDEQDMNRAAAPLVVPPHATVIDTSIFGIDEVVSEIVEACSVQARC